ncbi:MAG: T9SS type A sorting domain-containing protein [Bacteroidetes bacterium]|nr:T9SS type A sorting domain-containing protein [Bacteroidota bacterium]
MLITAYRYWTSDQDSMITEVNLPNPVSDFSQLVDANLLDRTLGDKNFTIQFKDNKGRWSSPLSDSITNIGEAHLDAIVPAVGGNIGDVTTTLYGGFFEGTKVMLVNAAGDTIRVPDSLINIIGGTDHFFATFDLRNRPLGLYDVVVTIPGDTVMKLVNGFEVVTGIPANVYASVVGFSTIRVNTTSSFTLSVGNDGNVDARGVLIGFAISDTIVSVEPQVSYYSPDDTTLGYTDTIPSVYKTDTLFEEAKWYKVFYVVIPILSPNSTQTLNFNLKTPTAQTITIKAWAQQPLYASPLSYEKVECIHQAISAVATSIFIFTPPGFGCVYSAIDNFIAPSIVYALTNDERANLLTFEKITKAVVNTATSCITDIIPGAELSFSQETIKYITKGATTGASLGINCTAWWLGIDEESNSVSVVNSFDPNDKIGPLGSGSQNFYSGAKDFPYLIHFENSDTATAAAQAVLITDTLDQNVFDLSTLQLGFISFNDTIINLPSGVSSYEKLVDMRPKANLVVEVKANLDQSTGILTWSFKTLDPITLQPTTDPLLGFLPPNVTAPEGEGSVFFTVKVKDNVPLGTQIKNDATICFDNNPCMQTNEWSNTLDNVLPSSAVNALPAITYDSTFQVSWSGNDLGSGVMQYNIFVSTNGGTFKPWLVNTSLTSSMFSGKLDSLYSYYSIAVDTAGNKELAPASPDATTLVGLPTGLSNATIAASCFVYPNPTSGKLTISLINPLKKNVNVTVLNSFGEIVDTKVFPSTGSRQQIGFTLEDLSDGIYFLRIQLGSHCFYKKIIAEK